MLKDRQHGNGYAVAAASERKKKVRPTQQRTIIILCQFFVSALNNFSKVSVKRQLDQLNVDKAQLKFVNYFSILLIRYEHARSIQFFFFFLNFILIFTIVIRDSFYLF